MRILFFALVTIAVVFAVQDLPGFRAHSPFDKSLNRFICPGDHKLQRLDCPYYELWSDGVWRPYVRCTGTGENGLWQSLAPILTHKTGEILRIVRGEAGGNCAATF